MTGRRKNHLCEALERHRLARGAARDAAEGVDHIADLATRALEQPRLAQQLLREIAATASNSLDSLEDAAGAFAAARRLIEQARSRLRR